MLPRWAERNRVFVSYSMPAERAFNETLAAELSGEIFEVCTRELMPRAPKEHQTQWCLRKCKSARAVLVVASNECQQDSVCRGEVEAARVLRRPVLFAKAKTFFANEWMKNISRNCVVIDLTPAMYEMNVKKLIDSLKEAIGTQGILILQRAILAQHYYTNSLDSSPRGVANIPGLKGNFSKSIRHY